MKNLFYFLLASLTLTFIACGDDECNPGNLDTNIIGTWDVSTDVSGVLIPVGTVQFNANGTVTDLDGALIPNEIGGVPLDNKTYEVQSNTMLVLTASSGPASVDLDVNVISYTCDEIVVETQGTEFTLKRDE